MEHSKAILAAPAPSETLAASQGESLISALIYDKENVKSLIRTKGDKQSYINYLLIFVLVHLYRKLLLVEIMKGILEIFQPPVHPQIEVMKIVVLLSPALV